MKKSKTLGGKKRAGKMNLGGAKTTKQAKVVF